MGRRATLQATFTKGELDPDLSERVDLEHYYDSLASAPNSIFHPQGGVSDRGGSTLISDADVLASGTRRRLRRGLVPLPLTAGMITAANGGTAANLVDQSAASLFTTNPNTADTFVCCEIDLGTAQFVDFVDLIGFKCELVAIDDAVRIDYWTGSAWATFADPLDAAPAKHIRTTARTRRFGTAPGGPGGIRVLARNWRVVVSGGNGITGTISISGLRLWQETANLTAIDVREVAREVGTSYEMVVTERNIDVFEAGRYVASIATPLAAQQIGEVGYGGGFDTMLVFHEQVETPRIVRQGSSGEWDIDVAPYANVPLLKAQVIFTGDQDEIQEISFAGIEAGDVVHLALGDLIAPSFVYATAAGLPAQIVAAVGALPGINPSGLTATLSAATPAVTLRWHGSGNGLRSWPLLSGMTAASGVTISTRVVQAGLYSSGYLFSAETGWPRCGTFIQTRLMLAGFRAAPTSFMFSRPSSWSYLDTSDPMTADLAFLRTLNADGIEIISSVFVGRHLQLFTAAGEWYVATQTLDATQPLAVIRTTSHGIRRAVPLAFSDGATLFVQQGGQTLRDMLWRDAEQSYSAEPLSVLSPQILSDVVDVAHRSARSVTEGNLIFLVNANGSAGVLTLLRGQNVIAGSPWTTSGSYKAAMCDVSHEVWLVVERGGERWLERWTPDMPLDFATTTTAPTGTISGATHLEGRTDVWAFADGEVLGPFTVTSGSFALGVVATSVTYGLLPAWTLRSQVLRDKVGELPFRPPARVYEVELSVKATGHLTLGVNGYPHAEVPLVRLGDAFTGGGPLQTVDGGAAILPMMGRLYTGNITMGGLLGWSDTPYLEIGRSVPAPVHIKAIRREIMMKSEGG